MRPFMLPLLLTAPALARAHEGHDAFGAHLHPAEALGLVGVVAVAALIVARFWRDR